LLVDDEADLLAELQPLLERMGFTIFTASDGEQALQLVESTAPNLIVLDVIMPRIDGREVLRRLRHSGNWTPVILLTHINNSIERTLGLQEGADDYLNKPFDPLELVARIQAVLRRSYQTLLSQTQPLSSYMHLICDELALERQIRRVKLNGTILNLSTRAVSVLEYLMLHAGEVITREQLLDQVWGWSYPVETRAVDIRISELRKALNDHSINPHYIETVVGYGYRLIGKVEGR
jgi:DNA-binding response OmpR family regulator